MNDGDWICSDANCGNINFARRTSCYRCNKERPNQKPFKKKLGTEIGKSAAEKSRGLFNADDWQCNKCANVNWARRQTCNVCNAPKFGEVEARTGYGGGYNERGVVEYRRREPSSDDEYDEFGRKRRKRKSDSQEKVGITEGPVNKKLPPTMLSKEAKDPVMPVSATNLPFYRSKDPEKVSGSLSDGSVCELPPLSKMAFRRHQIQNQIGYQKQDYMLPNYKTNGLQRRRFISTGDKDPAGSSGYETGSKTSKHIPPSFKHPVMENRVSSTNNDLVYKFTGSTPAETFEVTYSIEERVKAAAFAIVYNNCKISTEKFESMFDKPAPDFKTIFAWRQRLLLTGCLVDSHLETPKTIDDVECPTQPVDKSVNVKPKIPQKLLNPDEIIIPSDSDDDDDDVNVSIKSNNQNPSALRQKSASVETLLLGGGENEPERAGASTSTIDERQRNRSSSRDSRDSNYSDSDDEQESNVKANIPKKVQINFNSARQSTQDSDSESLSYDSAEVDFRSRKFGDIGKGKRKYKRRITSAKPHANVPNNTYPGYNTLKPAEKSPLVTGNIYTSNLHNMNVRNNQRNIATTAAFDTDGCSSEYVPTKLGSIAKNNYQDFKNNVKKKGFWAKGNGNSFTKNKQLANSEKPVELISHKVVQQAPVPAPINLYSAEQKGYMSVQAPKKDVDFTKDDLDNFVGMDSYVSFDKGMQSLFDKNQSLFDNNEQSSDTRKNVDTPLIENSSRIFDIVHSSDKGIQSLFDKNQSLFDNNQSSETTKTADTSLYVNSSRIFDVVHSSDKSIQSLFDKNQSLFDNDQSSETTKTVDTSLIENSSRIFDVVQSSTTAKNRSILDIFDTIGDIQKSPEAYDEEKAYESIKKTQMEWDDDDDALYNTSDSVVAAPAEKENAPQNTTPVKQPSQSPTDLLYQNSDSQKPENDELSSEFLREKQNDLFGLLKDLDNSSDNNQFINSSTPLISKLQNIPFNEHAASNKALNTLESKNKLLASRQQVHPKEEYNEIQKISEEIKGIKTCDIPMPKDKDVSPSKKVRVLETIIIKPDNKRHKNVKRQIDVEQTEQNISPPVQNNTDISNTVQNNPVENNQQQMPAVEVPQLDLSSLLSGINANTLFLALQNLQKLNQPQANSKNDSQQTGTENLENTNTRLETINLNNAATATLVRTPVTRWTQVPNKKKLGSKFKRGA